MNGECFNMRTRSILKIFSFTIFAIICFSQCASILNSYFQYPRVIDMFESSPNLISALPGITICNNNRLSLKKMVKRNGDIGKAFFEKFPDWAQQPRSLPRKRDFNYFRDEVAKIFKQFNYKPQTEIDEVTMNESFAVKPDSKPFIKWLGCARTWQDSVECDQLSQIDSVQDRRCITLLHQGAIVNDIINRPYLFNSTRSSAGQYAKFDAKEVVQMVLDFEPEDYADLKRQIGARIFFHANGHVAATSDLDYFVTRGFRYDFNIERNDLLLLKKPYGNGCWDYEATNLKKFKTTIDPRIPLYVNTCYQNCISGNVIHRTKCWPPMMPYFRNDPLDPDLNIKTCDWFREPNYYSIYKEMLRIEKLKADRRAGTKRNSNETLSAGLIKARKEMRAYSKIRKFCWSKCVLSCKLTRYSVTVTRTSWPSDVRILFDTSGKDKNLRHCCALITVRYPHFHHTVQEFIPKYNIVDTIGDMGGLLAVWLGLSMISVYHALQKLVEILNHRTILSKVHTIESRTTTLSKQRTISR